MLKQLRYQLKRIYEMSYDILIYRISAVCLSIQKCVMDVEDCTLLKFSFKISAWNFYKYISY